MPRIIQERYHLIDILGSGGMGVVHLGWDGVLERYVAVKRVRSPEGGVLDGSARAGGRSARRRSSSQGSGTRASWACTTSASTRTGSSS